MQIVIRNKETGELKKWAVRKPVERFLMILFAVFILIMILIAVRMTRDKKDSEVKGSLDGFELLGETPDEAAGFLGSSIPTGDGDNRFYPACGITLGFDEKGRINLVSNDGSALTDMQVAVFGVLPGNSFEDAKQAFEDKGLEVSEDEGGTFKTTFTVNRDKSVIYRETVTSDERGRVKTVEIAICGSED